jgi:hypothetical protein
MNPRLASPIPVPSRLDVTASQPSAVQLARRAQPPLQLHPPSLPDAQPPLRALPTYIPQPAAQPCCCSKCGRRGLKRLRCMAARRGVGCEVRGSVPPGPSRGDSRARGGIPGPYMKEWRWWLHWVRGPPQEETPGGGPGSAARPPGRPARGAGLAVRGAGGALGGQEQCIGRGACRALSREGARGPKAGSGLGISGAAPRLRLGGAQAAAHGRGWEAYGLAAPPPWGARSVAAQRARPAGRRGPPRAAGGGTNRCAAAVARARLVTAAVERQDRAPAPRGWRGRGESLGKEQAPGAC